MSLLARPSRDFAFNALFGRFVQHGIRRSQQSNGEVGHGDMLEKALSEHIGRQGVGLGFRV